MDAHKTEIVNAFKSNRLTAKKEDHYAEPAPNRPLNPENDLILPSVLGDNPGSTNCSNSVVRDDVWVTTRNYYGGGRSILSAVVQVCVEAKLCECKRKQCIETKEKMLKTAPACGWKAFRNWAVL